MFISQNILKSVRLQNLGEFLVSMICSWNILKIEKAYFEDICWVFLFEFNLGSLYKGLFINHITQNQVWVYDDPSEVSDNFDGKINTANFFSFPIGLGGFEVPFQVVESLEQNKQTYISLNFKNIAIEIYFN